MKPNVLLIAWCCLFAGGNTLYSQTSQPPSYFGTTQSGADPARASPAATPSLTQSALEKDLLRLQTEHQKALVASAEPVNRRYLSDLESLFSRARQANDTQAANEINAELQKLRLAIQGGATGMDSLTAEGLTKILVGKKWRWFHDETLTLLANGQAKWSGDPTPWPWKVSDPKGLVIESRNLNRNRNFKITFDQSLQTGLIEGDEATRQTQLIR